MLLLPVLFLETALSDRNNCYQPDDDCFPLSYYPRPLMGPSNRHWYSCPHWGGKDCWSGPRIICHLQSDNRCFCSVKKGQIESCPDGCTLTSKKGVFPYCNCPIWEKNCKNSGFLGIGEHHCHWAMGGQCHCTTDCKDEDAPW